MAIRTQIAATLLAWSMFSGAIAVESERTTPSPESFNTAYAQIDGVFARSESIPNDDLSDTSTTSELRAELNKTVNDGQGIAADAATSSLDTTDQGRSLSDATKLAGDSKTATPDLAAAGQQAELLQQALLKIYRSNLLKRTYRHVQYPASSIERNEEGDVILMVEILRSGKVKNIRYKTKAQAQALNLAARTAVKQARPFSAAPSALEGDSFKISMPIRFRLTE